MKNRIKKNFFMLILIFSFLAISGVNAETEFRERNNYSFKIDRETIRIGYTVDVFKGALKIGVFPDVLRAPTRINLKNISKLNHTIFKDGMDVVDMVEVGSVKIPPHFDPLGKNGGRDVAPAGWRFNSDIYEYDLTRKDAYNQKRPLIIELAFGKDTDNYKEIFYFNGDSQEWKKLPTTLNWQTGAARTKVHFPYLQLAVFDQIDIAGRGEASWYNQSLFRYFKYKNGDYAASRQYPKGAKLRVVNLANNRSVIVAINDYGPKPWTGRIIDLDISAFKKIGWKGLGVINVSVEPVY